MEIPTAILLTRKLLVSLPLECLSFPLKTRFICYLDSVEKGKNR